MILLKANPKLKNVFAKLVKTMNVTVAWTDVFVIVNNNLILAGDVRSLIFSFDNRKIYTNILEIPLGSKHIDSMPSDGMLENVINMSLYAFGKWGSIGALRVDKDYSSLNSLFESVLQPVNIEPAFNSENFRFYRNGIQITYEDTILEVLKFLRSEGKLKEGQNLITQAADEPDSETEENESYSEDTPVHEEYAHNNIEDDEYDSEIGLWNNLIWKKETCVFEKRSGSADSTSNSKIGHDFYITDNLCPRCREKLYMAMYPSGKELLIDTEEGRVFMARTYTCYNCNSFYTPRPKKLLQEGDVYSLKFDADRTAYEDYLSILGETAERTANYKFNEFETERNGGKNGNAKPDAFYINEFNRGAVPHDNINEAQDSESLDVQQAWKKAHAERVRAEHEKAEREIMERERREREKLEREREDQERLAREIAEQEHREFERIERLRAEQARLEREKLEWERAEHERIERERAEQERRDLERAERLRAEKEQLEREKLEWERAEQERLERDRAERERLEQERIERDRIERERLEQERLEWERTKQERLAREKAERERLEQERIEREKADQERREREKAEWERLEREKAEFEKAEKERLERERIEHEKAEKERLERERIEREKAEKERLERERIEREQAEKERAEQEESERIRKEQEKLAIRQEILLLAGKNTDELRKILSDLEHKNAAQTDENAISEEENNYMLAVRETLRKKLNAKYAARMGTLGNLSFQQLTDLKKQIESEYVLYNGEQEEYLEKIDTYLNKAEAEILDQKIELSRNKTYAEIERIMEEISKRSCPDDIKDSALNKLEQIKSERAAVEVEDLISHIPLHLDRKQLAVYLEKIDRYKGVDLSPYSELMAEKSNMAEEEEISAMMNHSEKKDRAALWSLYEELNTMDYKEENKAPYLEKIYDKVREMDKDQIDKLCPSVVHLSFDDGLAIYEQIEQGMFLPEIKTDALEMIKRHLTKLKTDESVQLMRKLKLNIEDILADSDRDSLYFYDDENNDAMMNAIDGYASQREPYEYPLMVCDASRSHTGKDGFVITPEHIFYHTVFNSGRINIADISEIKANNGLLSKGIYVKYYGGSKEKLPNNINPENWDTFARILDDFVNYLHEKTTMG
ncbi:MAG: hypothetical protein K2K21_13875 [Lachnospiraceae bacterium]|nr:hypothetical protein [Lachnospiraceae bacterium]